MADYRGWLKEWFARRAALPEDFGRRNYFEEGWIDSLAVIELVEDMETQFGLQFAPAQFQDRRFPTVDGLAEILAEMQR